MTEKSQSKLVLTADGSHTIYVPNLDEHYHSINGAINESETVFIKPGISFHKNNRIKILEIGFGTGLNALLTLIEADRLLRSIDYVTIEKYPVIPYLINRLNYSAGQNNKFSSEFMQLHNCCWEEQVNVTPTFNFKKHHCDIVDFKTKDSFDIIYFDAFAKSKQPDMWTDEIINKVCSLAADNALFLTYSATGSLKRQLIAQGFEVERLPGPKGKREITRALKIQR